MPSTYLPWSFVHESHSLASVSHLTCPPHSLWERSLSLCFSAVYSSLPHHLLLHSSSPTNLNILLPPYHFTTNLKHYQDAGPLEQRSRPIGSTPLQPVQLVADPSAQLLLKILETHDLSVDAKRVSAAWRK